MLQYPMSLNDQYVYKEHTKEKPEANKKMNEKAFDFDSGGGDQNNLAMSPGMLGTRKNWNKQGQPIPRALRGSADMWKNPTSLTYCLPHCERIR